MCNNDVVWWFFFFFRGAWHDLKPTDALKVSSSNSVAKDLQLWRAGIGQRRWIRAHCLELRAEIQHHAHGIGWCCFHICSVVDGTCIYGNYHVSMGTNNLYFTLNFEGRLFVESNPRALASFDRTWEGKGFLTMITELVLVLNQCRVFTCITFFYIRVACCKGAALLMRHSLHFITRVSLALDGDEMDTATETDDVSD